MISEEKVKIQNYCDLERNYKGKEYFQHSAIFKQFKYSAIVVLLHDWMRVQAGYLLSRDTEGLASELSVYWQLICPFYIEWTSFVTKRVVNDIRILGNLTSLTLPQIDIRHFFFESPIKRTFKATKKLIWNEEESEWGRDFWFRRNSVENIWL